ALHRLLLLGEVFLEPCDQAIAGVLRDHPCRLALERAPDEHRLAARRDVDPAHPRPALRQDLDESFVGQTAERLGYRKPRDAQALAERFLVDEFAGCEGERDDRLADGILDALHGATAPVARQRAQERVGQRLARTYRNVVASRLHNRKTPPAPVLFPR